MSPPYAGGRWRRWALPPWAMAREIGEAQRLITRSLGAPPRHFRAAVGMANGFVAPILERHRLVRVGWSARAYDTRTRDPARVWARIERTLAPGVVILLHDGAPHGGSVAILAHVLAKLDERGYRCVLPEIGRTEP